MRIMLLASSQVSIPPERGGAVEAIVFDLANFLSDRNEVFVVSRKRFTEKNITCVNVKSGIRKNKIASILEDMFYGLRCIGQIRKIKPDILHLHSTFTSLPIAIFRRFLPENTKIVYTSHSPAWTVPDREIGTANKIFNRLEAIVVRRSDITTAVSESLRQGMLRRKVSDKNKIVMIENFTRPDIFSGRYGKRWKAENNISGPMVLFVGKLTETKGIPYLLESAKEVKRKVPDVKYVLVGSLEHEQDLTTNPWLDMVKKNNLDDVVYFTGSVPFSELPRIYSSADVFVLPSLREGMPLVVLEALSTGLPIVTTKISGTAEVVDDRCAIFVKRRDSRGIARALVHVLKNKKTAKRMAHESLKRSKLFEKNNVLKKYLSLYYKINK